MAVRVSIQEETDKRTNNTASVVVLRRKVAGRWKRWRKRCDANRKDQRKIENHLESIAQTLDNDLSLDRSHDPSTLDQLKRLEQRWIELFDSAGLLEKYNTREDDLIQYLEQYSLELTDRCSRGEIGERHREKVDRHLKRLISFCNQKKVLCFTDFDIPFVKEWRAECLNLRKPQTVSKEFSYLRSCMDDAVEQGLTSFNPVASKQCRIETTQEEDDRRVYIREEHLTRVLEWYENHREDSPTRNGFCVWFNLVRWTGCRKNEALLLRWEMIDWDRNRLTMPSPKTAKKGVSKREMPLYPQLRPVLEREFIRQDSPQTGYVVVDVLNLSQKKRESLSEGSTNGGTTLTKHIKSAGILPWVKPFQNLRVTRENELLQSRQYRPEAVHSFIGHSSRTYLSNYLKLDDNDFLGINGPQNGPQKTPEPTGEPALSSHDKKKTPRFAGNREVSDIRIPEYITRPGLNPEQLFQCFMDFLKTTDHITDQTENQTL